MSSTSWSRLRWASSRDVRSSISTPARWASRRSASGNAIPSRRITNEKMSPPSPQPKQCHVSRAGVTMKLGVFSPWNGQSPLSVVPAFLSCTVSPTTSTTVSLLLTSAATPTANLPPRTRTAAPKASPERRIAGHRNGVSSLDTPVFRADDALDARRLSRGLSIPLGSTRSLCRAGSLEELHPRPTTDALLAGTGTKTSTYPSRRVTNEGPTRSNSGAPVPRGERPPCWSWRSASRLEPPRLKPAAAIGATTTVGRWPAPDPHRRLRAAGPGCRLGEPAHAQLPSGDRRTGPRSAPARVQPRAGPGRGTGMTAHRPDRRNAAPAFPAGPLGVRCPCGSARAARPIGP